MRTFYLFNLLIVTVLCCSCSRSIVFPATGVQNDLTIPYILDEYGHKMIDLRSNIDRVVYNGFYIENPQNARFRVYLTRNNCNYAEWLIFPQQKGFDFSCHALREQQQEIYDSVHELHSLYKRMWNRNRNSFAFESNVVKWNGLDVIRFQEKGRNPQDGRLIYTDGFALPDPMERDHIIEVKYIRCAYKNEIEKYGFRDLGELFLKSVFIGDGK